MSDENAPPQLSPFVLWLPIIAAIALAILWFDDSQSRKEGRLKTIDFSYVLEPKSYQQANQNIVELEQGRHGHAVFRGYINDKPVKFLLDTGASTVAMPETVANYLGLRRGAQQFSSTANGIAKSYQTNLAKVAVGNITLSNVHGSILPGMNGDEILLGMSFLKELRLMQESGKITLIQDAR